MKFKTGVWILVLIVVVGLALGTGLIIYSRFQKASPDSEMARRPGGTVYVDLSRLAKYHPSWNAVSALAGDNSVAEAVRAADLEIAAGRARKDFSPAAPSANPWIPKISREAAEADAVWNAVKSLDEWQNEQKTALDVRVSSNRKLMANVAASEIRKQSQDIEAAAMDKRREIEARYLIDRVNARMKVSALETAAAIQGFESDDIKVSLERARAELALLLGAYNADVDAVGQDLLMQISDVRTQANERVDADLMAYEIRQKRSINTRLAAFRDEIVQEMGVFTGSVASSGTEASDLGSGFESTQMRIRQLTGPERHPGLEPGRKTVATAARQDVLGSTVEVVRRQTALLRSRVLADVRRGVEQIAEERGEKVVFVRASGIPDRTSDYEEVIKKKAWGTWNPAGARNLPLTPSETEGAWSARNLPLAPSETEGRGRGVPLMTGGTWQP